MTLWRIEFERREPTEETPLATFLVDADKESEARLKAWQTLAREHPVKGWKMITVRLDTQ